MCVSQGSVQDQIFMCFKKTEIYLILMVDKPIVSDCIRSLGHSL